MKEYTSNSQGFSDKIKILETSDPVHADNVNITTKQLLENDAFLKNAINKNEVIATLATGQTSITCTLEGLDSNSSISVYADVPGVGYTDIVVDGDNVTVTFEEQKQDIQVKVVVADGMV